MKTNISFLISLLALITILAHGCAHDQPLAENGHDHEESIDGILLLINEIKVHRQFQGQESGVLELHAGQEQEVEVLFLDAHGDVFQPGEHAHGHESGEDHQGDHGHELELGFTGYDSALVEIDVHHHEEEGAGLRKSLRSEEEHEHLHFEIHTSQETGETAFTLWLLEEEEVLYRSLPVLIKVGEGH